MEFNVLPIEICVPFVTVPILGQSEDEAPLPHIKSIKLVNQKITGVLEFARIKSEIDFNPKAHRV